ncbi:hypothetical protein PVAP13_2KG186358 [Panicum virgatum]|uniref:Uncharacterized protein n=1 Tax=Panicum virgatum TaxID=38727 RepID=A0A8T0VWV2_PANVG|nr:hypothetical protein PVAP13_2KG186358 [Panicum virgatum]
MPIQVVTKEVRYIHELSLTPEHSMPVSSPVVLCLTFSATRRPWWSCIMQGRGRAHGRICSSSASLPHQQPSSAAPSFSLLPPPPMAAAAMAGPWHRQPSSAAPSSSLLMVTLPWLRLRPWWVHSASGQALPPPPPSSLLPPPSMAAALVEACAGPSRRRCSAAVVRERSRANGVALLRLAAVGDGHGKDEGSHARQVSVLPVPHWKSSAGGCPGR